METAKKFVAVQSDDGNVKLIPAEELQVVRMLDESPAPEKAESPSPAVTIFWILFLLALLWYFGGGWEMVYEVTK